MKEKYKIDALISFSSKAVWVFEEVGQEVRQSYNDVPLLVLTAWLYKICEIRSKSIHP